MTHDVLLALGDHGEEETRAVEAAFEAIRGRTRRAEIAELIELWGARPVEELCGTISYRAGFSGPGAIAVDDAFGDVAVLSLEDACSPDVQARMDPDTASRAVAFLAHSRHTMAVIVALHAGGGTA